jgi:ubiquinone/menaquinone biosynthesis C-methylase UbiE
LLLIGLMNQAKNHENRIDDWPGKSYRGDTLDLIREYWRKNLQGVEIARHPIGTRDFFDELEVYHYEKLDYLPKIIDFNAYKEKKLLDIGCGLGIDLVRFAKGGAIVTGVDLAGNALELAKRNLELHGVNGELLVMNGESLSFKDNTFDMVFAQSVLAYSVRPESMIREIYRVLKPGCEAILMMYNRNSWLFYLADLFGFKLGREDAPVFKTYSIGEFNKMLGNFSFVEIFVTRFPFKTRVHKGIKGRVYNYLLVPAFKLLPKRMVNSIGAHIIARAEK